MRKIGIFGGTFNPIHSGHALLINYISQCGLFDEIWVILNRRNPLKSDQPGVTDEERIAMLRMVADKFENVKVSDVELKLPVPSYTINTLQYLKSIHPENEFKIIIGTDNLNSFSQWKEADRIIKEFGLVVYKRAGCPYEIKPSDRIMLLEDVPSIEISSSLVREMIKQNKNINFVVPVEVANFISEKKLYK